MRDFVPGPAVSDEEALAVFADGPRLIEASVAEHGRYDSYRVSRVPSTNVFVLYGVREADKRVLLIRIRTWRGVQSN